jgi:hypothetical protein
MGASAERKKANEPSADADPVDLWGKFDPPALPEGLLPAVLERFARVQCDLMGADPGGMAAAALAVCAAAIPDEVQVQVKIHDPSWRVPARVWMALVGSPSTKKSPIIAAAAAPLRRIDRDLYRKWAKARAQYDRLPADERKVTEPPKKVRAVLEDTSIEAAQEVLADSPAGVLCLQDELSGWFGRMDAYSGGRGAAKDRGFWLRSFDGGHYAVDRIARGSGYIDNLSVCLLGGIQPEPIRKLAAEAQDDGLLQRLFPIVVRPATAGRDEPAPPVAREYADLVGQLRRYPVLPFVFDDGAQAIRRDLEAKHLELMTLEGINPKLAAHIGKYDGLFARLCVLWHCVEHPLGLQVPTAIPEATARRVADFLHGFLLRHAFAFYAGTLGLTDDHDRLAELAGHILTHGLEVVTSRDVQRGVHNMRKLDGREVLRLFEQLEAFGWVERTPGKRPSDPPWWRVNPVVHQRFADRAQAEAVRRQKARAALGGGR